ncbi:GTPase-interacting component 2 [Monosporozyma unispora]|nr:hypothetical protein C6P44_003430 [Kazachstania unispora]
MIVNQQLPQMKSIWIDEDQEAEKLYSLQAQQLMGGDEFNITMVNSDKPALNNKKQIDLRPLTKKSNSPKLYQKKKHAKAYQQPLQQTNKVKHKKSILNLFRSNSISHKKQQQPASRVISGPFDFQHISHAGGKEDEEESQEEPSQTKQDNPMTTDDSTKDLISLNKAFVTQTLRPESVGSSLYTNSMKSENQHDRIMSMSTTATTFLERTPSFNKIKRLSNNKLLSSAQRNHFTTTERPDSMGSNLSINFLKNYSFPTLLEDEQIKDFNELEQPVEIEQESTTATTTTTDLSMKHTKNQSISSSFSTTSSSYSSLKPPPTNTNTPNTRSHKRNSSAPGSLTTPELEQFLFSDSAFKDRISVDDILRYYNTTNEGELILNQTSNNVDQNDDSNRIIPQTQYL